mmetsp:Transcript_54994/g.131421  ORF Transcript_54994/g.131421 Transcript_54994/m.131421 type:complete len:275 (+) Transcript_54994:160-984(+)
MEICPGFASKSWLVRCTGSPPRRSTTPCGQPSAIRGSFSLSQVNTRSCSCSMASADDSWIGPTGTGLPVPSSMRIRILPRRICISSSRSFCTSALFARCASRPSCQACCCLESPSAAMMSICCRARLSDATSCWTFWNKLGRKCLWIDRPRSSGKASSLKSSAAFGTMLAKCAFAACTAWIFSRTSASRCFCARCCARAASFSRQRTHSSSTCSCHAAIIFLCLSYHSSLKLCIVLSSCSSSTSMMDCSSVFITRTSRMGSTSRSKSKSSPSST